MARNAETSPITAVKRPNRTPAPAKSLSAGVPSMDSGHTQDNFPGLPHGAVGGIPEVANSNRLLTGYTQGDLLDMPGATVGERGGHN